MQRKAGTCEQVTEVDGLNSRSESDSETVVFNISFCFAVLLGVWIGPFQEQPGESPERPGVRTDQPARYVTASRFI